MPIFNITAFHPTTPNPAISTFLNPVSHNLIFGFHTPFNPVPYKPLISAKHTFLILVLPKPQNSALYITLFPLLSQQFQTLHFLKPKFCHPYIPEHYPPKDLYQLSIYCLSSPKPAFFACTMIRDLGFISIPLFPVVRC